MMKVSLNKTKAIGQVIYVVEGDKTEPDLIKHIYSSVLGYSVVQYSKLDDRVVLLQGTDKYSRVFVVPALDSSVKHLCSGLSDDYFDRVYQLLSIDYGLDVENSAVFYLFDRDRESNRPKHFLNAICKYVCSRGVYDNNEMNGLFLPSYPCIEAFLMNANVDQHDVSCGRDAKAYISSQGYNIEGLNEGLLENATFLMLILIESITGIKFNDNQLDNFESTNKSVFNYEETKWKKDRLYTSLSLLSISLLDLGIINLS